MIEDASPVWILTSPLLACTYPIKLRTTAPISAKYRLDQTCTIRASS